MHIRTSALTWKEVEGEIVVLDLRSSTYFTANPSGSLLWKLMVEGSSRQRLVDALVGEFGIDSDQAAHDVYVFLDELAGHGLVDRLVERQVEGLVEGEDEREDEREVVREVHRQREEDFEAEDDGEDEEVPV